VTGLYSAPFLRWLRVVRSALLVEAGLHTRSLDSLVSVLGIELADRELKRDRAPGASAVSTQVRWAFDATDRLLGMLPGRSHCLRRALIAGHLLREHKPALHIGSARRDGRWTFHAWLELDGQVAADPDAALYRRLVRARPTS
jgi:hypothetical protein